MHDLFFIHFYIWFSFLILNHFSSKRNPHIVKSSDSTKLGSVPEFQLCIRYMLILRDTVMNKTKCFLLSSKFNGGNMSKGGYMTGNLSKEIYRLDPRFSLEGSRKAYYRRSDTCQYALFLSTFCDHRDFHKFNSLFDTWENRRFKKHKHYTPQQYRNKLIPEAFEQGCRYSLEMLSFLFWEVHQRDKLLYIS